jgi:HK97 family phage portal protein
MSIIGGILNSVGGYESDPIHDHRLWTPSAAASVRTTSGEMVNPDSALVLGTYFACLMVLSQDVAKISRHLYRRTGEQERARESGDHRYWMVHDEPNEETTDMTFVETVTHWAAGWGNGYAEIVRDGRGAPMSMFPIHPSRVEPKRRKDGGAIYYRISINDMNERARATMDGRVASHIEIEPENMLHIRGMGNDLAGYSVARLAAETLGQAIAVRRFGAAFFGNGANSNLVIKHEGNLTEQALGHLRQSIADTHGGAGNAHRPWILEEGMTVEKMSVPPNEAQFLETLRASVPEVCAWFRMPPHMVGHLDNAIKANIEEQSLSYAPNTILPWTRRWDKELNRKLLTHKERTTRVLYFEHDLKSLLMADSKARAEFYKTLREMGAITGNEIRASENMDNMGPLGDVFLVPVNYGTLDKVVNGTQDDAAEAEKMEAENAAADLNFRREVVKQMVADGTFGDVVFNMTDGRTLLEGVNLPVVADAAKPWLPVVAAQGPLVSGAVMVDAEGRIVGGDVVEPPEPQPVAHTPSAPTATPVAEPDDGEQMRIAGKSTMRLFVQAADRTLGKLAAREQRKGEADDEYLAKLAAEMAENMGPAAETMLELAFGGAGLTARRPEAMRRLGDACVSSLPTRDMGTIAAAAQEAVAAGHNNTPASKGDEVTT